MQVDCEKGKKTEIEVFTGYVVRCDEELGRKAGGEVHHVREMV
jgi:ketopantoate reductase